MSLRPQMEHVRELKKVFQATARGAARKTSFGSKQESRAFRDKARKLVDGLEKSIPHVYLPASWASHESLRYKAFLNAHQTIKQLASESFLLEWAAKIYALENRLHNARATASRHRSHGHPVTAKTFAQEATILEKALAEHKSTFEKTVFFHYGERLGAPANHSIEPDLAAHNAAKWLLEHHEILLKMFPRKG